MFIALELCLAAVCIPLALMLPDLGEAQLSRIERKFSAFSERKHLVVVCIGLLALGLRLALLPMLPIPQPKVSDEFSYLLQADTFAHGRLANPSSPMWVHFETFQENWIPKYGSMYYPGYGALLALGQVATGHPFWGVWVSSGLMCAAICWALQGWMPAGWALLGGLLAVVRLGSFSYWTNSYWGGTVTALGGALVIGALPRIRKEMHTRDSLLLAAGMATLAYTRPYEGLFFCVPVLIALIWWAKASSIPVTKFLSRIALPVGLVMLIAISLLAFFFYSLTGSPFTTPYQINMHTYGLMYFPWEPIRSVTFRHPEMQEFYRGGSVVGWYHEAREHPRRLQSLKAFVVWMFYFGPILSLPILAWLFTRPRHGFWKSFSPDLRFLLILCATTWLSCTLTIYIGQPHYVAALTTAFYAIILLTLREMYDSGNPSLKFLARAIPTICFVLLVVRITAPFAGFEPKPSWIRTWCSQDEQNLERARVLSELEHAPGKHLVIVHYKPNHDFILDEWVYNHADINQSKVIWARDMGVQNAELLRYFSDRHAWLAEPDYSPARVSPYDH